MGRAILTLTGASSRSTAAHWVAIAPDLSRVTFQGPQRTIPQNDRMWVLLTFIADTKELSEYMDAMSRHFRKDGVQLTDPEMRGIEKMQR